MPSQPVCATRPNKSDPPAHLGDEAKIVDRDMNQTRNLPCSLVLIILPRKKGVDHFKLKLNLEIFCVLYGLVLNYYNVKYG